MVTEDESGAHLFEVESAFRLHETLERRLAFQPQVCADVMEEVGKLLCDSAALQRACQPMEEVRGAKAAGRLWGVQ